MEQELMEELNANAGQTSLALRRRFAAQAFATSAAYDSAIAGWINGQLGTDAPVVRRGPHTCSSLSHRPPPLELPLFFPLTGMRPRRVVLKKSL